ncbi:uncharacterized protein EV422DRAFT_563781 [Fimicolochytrium jonesii]|uniref:uncharacterized protein n=1 Tax=Fimicolochytrium jonesii TaxID=1396493 RepID=UPI0022FEC01D|nr:uncharacterized protein EV422DRAFT_563781 [Fimicolochytrium jonesii]KAI8825965.1 hypothetical protein EV422DRAFT_563781 [Fimicolochytrium jonesii]
MKTTVGNAALVVVRSARRSPILQRCFHATAGSSQARLVDTSHPFYATASADWTALSLNHPLLHNQTGIRIHLVGIHHSSPASIDRVNSVIDHVKPAAVCIETDKSRMDLCVAKAAVVLRPSDDPLSGGVDMRIPPRLRGVQTIISPSGPNSSASPAFANLTPKDHDTLSRLGLDPALHLSSDHLHYGLEMAAAIHSALRHSAIVRAIDIHPNVLRNNPAHSQLIEKLIRRYRLLPPSSRKASAVGNAVFWIIQKLAFGWRRDVGAETNADQTSVRDHAMYMRCWKSFYPNPYFWWFEIRNAGMVEQLRNCVRDVAIASKILTPEGVEQRGVERPTIVAVVGKSHVFGMAELWDHFAATEKLKWNPSRDVVGAPLVGEDISSLDELLKAADIARKQPVPVQRTVKVAEEIVPADMRRGVRIAPSAGEPVSPLPPKRGSQVAPPPPPTRSPPRIPTGLKYVD